MPCQKNSAPFRFRASRKSRESCMSAEFFFLSRIGPAPPGFDPDTGPLHRNEGILSDALVKLSTKCRQLERQKWELPKKLPFLHRLYRERGLPSPLALSPCESDLFCMGLSTV